LNATVRLRGRRFEGRGRYTPPRKTANPRNAPVAGCPAVTCWSRVRRPLSARAEIFPEHFDEP
jgi:hypothetical protein